MKPITKSTPNTKEYTVRVTRKLIEAGEPKNCGKCPVAKALAARRPDLRFTVMAKRIFIYPNDGIPKRCITDATEVVRTPATARNFIRKFDSLTVWSNDNGDKWTDSFEPFSFKLRLPIKRKTAAK
jgi:hypothetical protein